MDELESDVFVAVLVDGVPLVLIEEDDFTVVVELLRVEELLSRHGLDVLLN